FRVGPAVGDVRPPVTSAAVAALEPPLRVGTVGGLVRFRAAVRDESGIDRVEFFVDGTLIPKRLAAPFQQDFDSRNLPNGTHTLVVRAWDIAGNVGEAKTTFEVFNQATVSRPVLARHYSHIRYAALAYNGSTIGPNEEKLLRESVDLVAPHARYLDRINQIVPTTPQLLYSNISNLYLDLLTDWLNFADRRGMSRESAFYHVAAPTPFLGDSPSSQPVTWFWNVQRGPTTGSTGFTGLTTESRSGLTGDLRFGGAGESIYLGYPGRFRELNVTMWQAGGVAWSGTLEYPSQADATGRPIAWKPLLPVTDTTGHLRLGGQVTFDPPTDWKPALVAGSSARLFYVRIRTTAGGADLAPIASRILGRDYVNANGARAGTIPAFDATADANHDGYLSDTEYAPRHAGFDARFAYESRLFYPYYGQMRFVTNPSGAGVRAWAVDYHRRLLAAHPQADGIFMDNSGGKAPTNKASLVESIDTYASDFGAVLGSVNRGIAPKWVLANTSAGGADADRVVQQVPATIEEFALRPLAHNWVQFRDTSAMVARRLSLTDPSGYLILDTLSTGGSPTDPRTRIAALAYYYLVADPDSTFLMTWGGEEPASAWSRHWFDAIAYNVGLPKGGWSEFASGADPTNAALTYRVFQRAYDNALVLYKPLSYATGKGTGTRDDATATTHPLDGNYRALNSDGTFGPVVNSVTLRNGEGAILIRA
ncbi:MAG TPA: Ig-like domain-containing protein, partial [Gemmataceae bacterium]|nr:Ig-like domain-containing protein [Gemmataceae bacterium]